MRIALTVVTNLVVKQNEKNPQHSRQEGSFMRKNDDRLLHVECVSAPHEYVFGKIVNFSLDINSSKQCAHDTASGFIRRRN